MTKAKARLKKKGPFEAWYESLDDRTAQRRIDRRLARFEDGDTCDCWSVGEGVYEMRFHFGSGWRVYYCQAALNVYWLLGGGTKDTQKNDVKIAKRTKKMLEAQDERI